MALRLHPLNGDSVGLGMEQEEEEWFEDPGNVMSLKDLIQPSPTNCTGTWIPVAQAVQHYKERSEG